MSREYGYNFRAPKVDVHQFAMVPRANIPRSSFRMEHQHKTTLQASLLTPVYLQEVLPGDSFNVQMTMFVRLSTPLYPLMDTLQLESFFFFCPCRLVWINWAKFMGEQDLPTDSISYSIPQVVSPAGGFLPNTIYDYFGLPTNSQTLAGNTISVNALPFRAYSLTWNQWFRDENLQNSVGFGSANTPGYVSMDNGPDPYTNYSLLSAAKRHDYFTSGLPWTQKGAAVTLPLGSQAIVKTSTTPLFTGAQNAITFLNAGGTAPAGNVALGLTAGGAGQTTTTSVTGQSSVYPSNLYADLSTATSATINAIRLAFQTQKLLERDARAGTRYTEIIRSHFGVLSPDGRLQRVEYLGGGKSPVNITPVPQTSGTGATGTTTPVGTLGGVGLGVHSHGFRHSFTEHGYVLGLVTIRADQLYQQGIRKLWSRTTRYDFYFPVFACLGEQSILNKELYSDGSANDALTFAYIERWAEYRYHPSYTSAYFRSTATAPLDAWHLGIKFSALPALNASWIVDPTSTILQRNLTLGVNANYQQFLADFFFSERAARPMPMYSVPGLIDHF